MQQHVMTTQGFSQTEGRSRAGAIATAAVVGLVLTALTVLLLEPLSTHPASLLYAGNAFGRAPLAKADVKLNAWILAWGSHAMAEGGLARFFDANIFWPARSALAYSEHMIGVLPLFAPIYLATGQLALSFNLWTMTTFVLSGAAMYWVVLRTLASHPAAAVAAVFYAFAPWRFFELMHVQALSVQYLPLLAYLSWYGVKLPSVARAALLLVLLALQALSSYYLAYVALLVVGVAAIGAALAEGPRLRAAELRGLAYTLAASAAVVTLLYAISGPYLRLDSAGLLARESKVLDPWPSMIRFLLPGDGVVAPIARLVWTMPLVLSVAGFVAGVTRPELRACTIVTAVLVIAAGVLALGPSARVAGFDAGYPFRLAGVLVPGWLSLRVHVRFAIAAWLGVSFLSAVGFARLAGRPVLVATLAVVCAVSYVAAIQSLTLPVDPAPESAGEIGAYRWLAAHGELDPVLELPLTASTFEAHYGYMSTIHWSPIVNGYSGYRPPSYELMASLATALPDPHALRTLVRLGLVRWLVVHTDRHWLGSQPWRAPGSRPGILRYQDADTLIFELAYERGDARPELQPQHALVSLLGTSTRQLANEELRARVSVETREKVADARFREIAVRMQVTNLSGTAWPAISVDPAGLVGIELEARRAGTHSFHRLPGFHRLPTDVDAGASVFVTPRFRMDRRPGEYEVVPCIAQAETTARRCFPDASVRVAVR